MVGNDVEGIGGRDLIEVGAAYVVRLLRLMDRGLEKVLIKHSVMASMPFDGFVVKIVDGFAGKEFGFGLKAHLRPRVRYRWRSCSASLRSRPS